MTDSDEECLEHLLTQALELRERGEPVDVGALCAEQPHLEAAVTAALARLPQLAAMHREPSAHDALVGRSLGGRYRIDERIGAGAMGVVYRAFDLELAREVAVKLLRPELVVGERMDARLAREGLVLAAIRHPNVVAVFDRGKADDGRTFLVMELLRGQNASTLMASIGSTTARSAAMEEALGHDLVDGDVRQVVRWIVAAAAGLQAAHDRGAVHRDVKPSNLFLERSGRVVLVDFGIVSLGEHGTLGGEGSPFGTPAYLAPEQLDAGVQPDVRSDVYSLAGTLYHLLTGRPPFDGTPRQVLAAVQSRDPVPIERARPGLPVDLAAIVEKGMAKDPSQRYPSARAMRDDLVAWLEYRPIAARRASRWASAWRRACRSQRVRAAAGALFVAGLAIGGWQWSVARHDARAVRERESWSRLPSSLVNDPPEFRAASALRHSAAIVSLLDELVAVDSSGAGLAVRAMHRADGGDLAGAADDLEELAAGGDAPFALAAASCYRRGERPDAMTAGAEAPATGAAGDRFAAALHAMRSRGSPAPWVDALLDREGATDRLPGFAELRLLIGLRRVVDSGEVHGLTEVAHAARKLHAQRGSESAIGLFVLMNEAAARSASSADLELAERAQQLAPEDFPLFAVGGTLALQLDDWTRAAASFERAAALQPHSVHAAAGLCRALIGAGRFGEVDARLQGDVFASTAAGRAQRDLLTGIGLYRRAMLASDPAAADAAATGPTRARALFEQARAAFERAREATADRAPTSLEELMCDAMLGGELAADQAFDLLADAPLDAYLLRELARRLPAALDAHEVSALRRFMLLQAEALGMRTR